MENVANNHANMLPVRAPSIARTTLSVNCSQDLTAFGLTNIASEQFIPKAKSIRLDCLYLVILLSAVVGLCERLLFSS